MEPGSVREISKDEWESSTESMNYAGVSLKGVLSGLIRSSKTIQAVIKRTMSKLEEVRKAVIAAVPEIETDLSVCPKCKGSGASDINNYDEPCDCPGSVGTIEGRPIRLADVLVAVQNTGISVTFYGADKLWFLRSPTVHGRQNTTWNLRTDWDGQTEELKMFVHSLLCV